MGGGRNVGAGQLFSERTDDCFRGHAAKRIGRRRILTSVRGFIGHENHATQRGRRARRGQNRLFPPRTGRKLVVDGRTKRTSNKTKCSVFDLIVSVCVRKRHVSRIYCRSTGIISARTCANREIVSPVNTQNSETKKPVKVLVKSKFSFRHRVEISARVPYYYGRFSVQI